MLREERMFGGLVGTVSSAFLILRRSAGGSSPEEENSWRARHLRERVERDMASPNDDSVHSQHHIPESADLGQRRREQVLQRQHNPAWGASAKVQVLSGGQSNQPPQARGSSNQLPKSLWGL